MTMRLQDCSFSYGRGGNVIQDLTLDLNDRRTVLLGPNGAGKSTLLSLFASLLLPKSGSVEMSGIDSGARNRRKEYRRSVGFLPQAVSPIRGLTTREQVAYVGWAKGLTKAEAWQRSGPALRAVDLVGQADKASRNLSGGQLRRLGIAQAVVHEPKALILDEPFANLDIEQKGHVRAILGSLPVETAIVVSTHEIADVATSYGEVIILDDGAVSFQGSPQMLMERAGKEISSVGLEEAYLDLVRGAKPPGNLDA